ncbi:MAG: hypothetical protein A3F13_04530 [Gammaproteobacteria bacterium RIFCSPHIGHO2_12_FULL_40_19]|nr:MAG: hypothetical protein A3F13_04530 [Gammaproteobacteria bacterium RIFCSPHIGHO2_12_FULL_40_19]
MQTGILLALFLMINFLSFSATAASNPIYKSIDEKGVVTYSDQPNAQAEAVILPKENISKRPINSANTTNATDAASTDKREEYTAFSISSPKDQDTFQNPTEISVSVSITPALQKGDTIEFYLDGTSVASSSTTTSISIPKVRNNTAVITRGSHTLSAAILNAAGEKLMTTPSITIFVHYTSVAMHSHHFSRKT